MSLRLFIATLATLVLTGCAYQSSVQVAPAFDVYSSYEDIIPGDWYVSVNADEFGQSDVRFSGFSCSAHTYPLDISQTFTQSALRTIDNIVENVTLVDNPVPQEQIERSGYAGQILLRGEEIDADLRYHPGFWSSDAEAEVDITLTVLVNGQNGRLLGTTVSGDAENTHNAGSFCGGGADALGEAAQEAVRNALQRVAEAISNSPRIRAMFDSS